MVALCEEGEGEGNGCFVVTVLLELITLDAALLSQAELMSPAVREALPEPD